jgi:ergothioneine biosynthesis protein EgtB
MSIHKTITQPNLIMLSTLDSIRAVKEQLQQEFNNIRAATIELCQPLAIEDYVIQSAPFMSPPRWHVGHTSWFFEMLLTRFMPEYKIYSEEFLYYFNSYYEGFGVRINRQKRGAVSRPTVHETFLYRSRIDGHINILFERIPTHPDAQELVRLLRLGCEHEMQHQELLVYDIKHLLADQYIPAELAPMPLVRVSVEATSAKATSAKATSAKATLAKATSAKATSVEGEVEFTASMMELGTSAADHLFAWDNECPRHKVYVNAFALDKRLVTNAEYLEFMRSGGYTDYRWWLSAGWEWLQTESIKAPMYWERTGEETSLWNIRDYRGVRLAENNEPVAHISYYEASAYAKWRGKRLPTEAEWEYACTYTPKAGLPKAGLQETGIKQNFPWGNQLTEAYHANLFENKIWCASEAGTFPEGATESGLQQMIGDLWEWTSSDYAPFPGFTTQFDEYNDKWFVGQKVLRGGSHATPRLSVRSTYRNFFAPADRWMCSGFRCARTLSESMLEG